MRWLIVAILAALLFLPGSAANEEPWAIHAEEEVKSSSAVELREVYVPNSLEDTPLPPPNHVQWTWWSWSSETGSSWPDDDALYRASNRNISLNATSNEATTESHQHPTSSLVEVVGQVKVVSAEDRARMVAFDLELTPLQNLSNHTILYVVLTEDRAYDQHQRQLEHLVREMRPEVGFSVKANNTTSFVSMLPADHLEAAGVDLTTQPTGWSYTIAVFGSEDDSSTESRLLWMAHGDLPSPSQQVSANQAWTPLLLTAITAVIAVSLISAIRQRQEAIPRLRAMWSTDERDTVRVHLHAGSLPFRITSWTAMSPWQFKGRPPRLQLKAGDRMEIHVEFKDLCHEDCHFEVAIEIEDFGAWKQHLWLRGPSGVSSEEFTKEEE